MSDAVDNLGVFAAVKPSLNFKKDTSAASVVPESPTCVMKLSSRGRLKQTHLTVPDDLQSVMTGGSFELTPLPKRHRCSRRASMNDAIIAVGVVQPNKTAASRPPLDSKLSSRGRLSQQYNYLFNKTMQDMESIMTVDSCERAVPREHSFDRRLSIGDAQAPTLESKLSSRGCLLQSFHSPNKTDIESVMTGDSLEQAQAPRKHHSCRRASMSDMGSSQATKAPPAKPSSPALPKVSYRIEAVQRRQRRASMNDTTSLERFVRPGILSASPPKAKVKKPNLMRLPKLALELCRSMDSNVKTCDAVMPPPRPTKRRYARRASMGDTMEFDQIISLDRRPGQATASYEDVASQPMCSHE
jgi:hypothetical protein